MAGFISLRFVFLLAAVFVVVLTATKASSKASENITVVEPPTIGNSFLVLRLGGILVIAAGGVLVIAARGATISL